MKPYKIVLYLFLLVLSLSNVYWIAKTGKNVNIIRSLKQSNDLIQSIKETQLELRLLQIKSEGTHIDLSEKIVDENGKANRIIDLIKGYPFRIFLRYSQIGCRICIDKTIQLLQKEFPDSLRNRIILLSKQSTKKDLVIFRRIHNIKNPFYQYDKNLTSIDNINIPYFLIINNDGAIAKVFIPQDGIDEELTKAYLKYIAQLLKD